MRKKAVTTNKTTLQKRTYEQRMAQAEMLLDVSRKVAAIDSLDEVLGVLMEMSTYELGAERSSLFLNDDRTSGGRAPYFHDIILTPYDDVVRSRYHTIMLS